MAHDINKLEDIDIKQDKKESIILSLIKRFIYILTRCTMILALTAIILGTLIAWLYYGIEQAYKGNFWHLIIAVVMAISILIFIVDLITDGI